MGFDSINNKFFLNMPLCLYNRILDAFNKIWRTGIIPQDFKLSTLIPILKPNKDPNSVESYRPIALLSCFGKLLEKIIHKRLYALIENKYSLPTFQCGFRSQHSCTDILIYLEHFIQLTLRTQKVLIIVFFDIEKAFDTASHIEIMHNLYKIGMRGRMLRWFKDYFSGRQFSVRIGNSFSERQDLACGVPQGSILSPLLFSILLSNIPTFDSVHSLLYADDLSMFVVDHTMDAALLKIQSAVNDMNTWLSGIGLKLNRLKSSYMIFTRKRITHIPPLYLENQLIQFVTSFKFLGLYLDGPFLTWRRHTRYVQEICNRKINIMKCLASTRWGAGRDLLIKFYKSYILSRITYGLEIYSSGSNTTLGKLEVIQNSALRIITGLLKSTQIPCLQFESNIYSLVVKTQIVIMRYLYRVFSYPSVHLVAELFRNNWTSVQDISWRTLPHKAPFLIRALRISEKLNLQISIPQNLKLFIESPWLSKHNNISVKFLEGNKSTSSEIEVKSRFVECVHMKYNGYLQIFTDGSRMEDNLVGAALYIPQSQHVETWKLDSRHSILVAELYAIMQALLWILRDQVDRSYVVFTDSLSALMLLLAPKKKSHKRITSLIIELFERFSNLNKQVVLQWIPSHKGITDNEKVDALAREACTTGQVVLVEFEFEENIKLLNKQVELCVNNQWEKCKAENLFITRVINQLKEYKWITLGNRNSDVLMARFRTGCVKLQKFLFNIKQVDSPLCTGCGRKAETIFHFVFECSANSVARKTLVDALDDLNIKPNLINMCLLFTGGSFEKNKRLKIMKTFLRYVHDTGRENL